MTHPPTHVQLCCIIVIRMCLTDFGGLRSGERASASEARLHGVYLGWRILRLHDTQPPSRLSTVMKGMMHT
jgi:hypothetical protein